MRKIECIFKLLVILLIAAFLFQIIILLVNNSTTFNIDIYNLKLRNVDMTYDYYINDAEYLEFNSTVQQERLNDQVNEGFFINFFKSSLFINVISSWLWEITLSIIGSIFLYCIISKSAFRLIKRVYPQKLKNRLFPKEHSWFGNNEPNEIYIPARVYSKNKPKEYSLLDYFNNDLFNIPATYAIVGNAGEGKTFSLSIIALNLLKFFSFNKKKKIIRIPFIINFTDICDIKDNNDVIDCIYNNFCSVIGIKKHIFFRI